MIQITPKSAPVNLNSITIQPKAVKPKFFFGLGWNFKDGKQEGYDLDLLGVVLKDKEVLGYVYFGQKTAPGLQLSEDNTTGKGPGDDEFLVLDTAALPAEANRVRIGVGVYAGIPDFTHVSGMHMRVCDGDNKDAPEKIQCEVSHCIEKDTSLHVASLDKNAAGEWELTTPCEYSNGGPAGAAAVEFFLNSFSK